MSYLKWLLLPFQQGCRLDDIWLMGFAFIGIIGVLIYIARRGGRHPEPTEV